MKGRIRWRGALIYLVLDFFPCISGTAKELGGGEDRRGFKRGVE